MICQVMVMKHKSSILAVILAGLACISLLVIAGRLNVGPAVVADVPAEPTAESAPPVAEPAAGVRLAGGASNKETGGRSTDPADAAGSACECPDVYRLWFEEPPMTGSQVSDLQEGLAMAGFYSGSLDGVFGRGTQEAVMKFQTSAGLTDTGIADMATWTALGRTCEPLVDAMFKREHPELEAQLVQSDVIAVSQRMILIDTSDLSLTVLEDGLPVARFRVGIGEPETPTPLGQFRIADKAAWAGGFGTRWMGLNVMWGKFGIHGTNKPWSVGQRKSGGCIRMLNRDVEKLYAMVGVGTPVMITAGHFGIFGTGRPLVTPGWKGSMVFEIQQRLIRMGYLDGPADGAYGPNSERAIMRLQKDNGLPATGEVDGPTYKALGLEIID